MIPFRYDQRLPCARRAQPEQRASGAPVFDRALGFLLVRYERPLLRARLRLRGRCTQLRTRAGDLGLRQLKRRLQG
jgi:hypothetical protein